MDEIAYMNFIKQEQENERVAKETLKAVLDMARDLFPEGKINIKKTLFMFVRDGAITREEKRLIEEYCKKELMEIENG